MFCSVLSAAISGVEVIPVRVEADVSEGLPCFTMVGYAGAQVREAQDRVRISLKNMGIHMPPKRITINLSPGNIRKEGTRFDLPIAASVLAAMGRIPESALEGWMILGELHLDGRVEGVTGILPSILKARETGCKGCIIPGQNIREGTIVGGIEVVGVDTLEEFLEYARHGRGKRESQKQGAVQKLVCDKNDCNKVSCDIICCDKDSRESSGEDEKTDFTEVDFAQIRGQESVKRVSVIASAGFHNLLLSGPPGSGKSMAARRLPTIMPQLTEEESLEITGIYSIMGLLPEGHTLMRSRPFRAPHHTVSPAALCGGGRIPHPGEITLAHRGVLFLDELPEMKNVTLEMLRQPLEDRKITVSRLDRCYCFPAEFLLVAAMNPCPCGYYPDRNRCTCLPGEILRYRQRLSQPILDRIDLRCDVPEVGWQDLTGSGAKTLSSAEMREKVTSAVRIQRERYREESWLFNSELQPEVLDKYCGMTEEAERMISCAFSKLGLSARGYHRILKIARTIADLDGEEMIASCHIGEAIGYRSREQYGNDVLLQKV